MDQYDRQCPSGGDRQPESSTPIYDRLLAEWREAARSPEREAPATSARGGESAFVPAARTAGHGGAGG